MAKRKMRELAQDGTNGKTACEGEPTKPIPPQEPSPLYLRPGMATPKSLAAVQAVRIRAAIEAHRPPLIGRVLDEARAEHDPPPEPVIELILNATMADLALIGEEFPLERDTPLSNEEIAAKAFRAGVMVGVRGVAALLEKRRMHAANRQGSRSRKADAGREEVKNKLADLIYDHDLQTPEALIEFLHPAPKGDLPAWLQPKSKSRHTHGISASVQRDAKRFVFGLEGTASTWSVGRTALLRFIRKWRPKAEKPT